MNDIDHVNAAGDDARLERWLATTPRRHRRPDRGAVLRSTLDKVPATQQRQRWWARGGGRTRSHTNETEANGRLGTPGRSRTMMGPSGIAAGFAIAALAAASLVVVQQAPPAEPPAGLAPIAASHAATFDGTRGSQPGEVVMGDVSSANGVLRNRGQITNGIDVESSDPRFSGELDFVWHEDKYTRVRTGVFWGEQVLRNGEGAWQGSLVGAGDPTIGSYQASGQFVGSGAYEGLVAIVFFDSDLTHEGVIIPGPLPPRE